MHGWTSLVLAVQPASKQDLGISGGSEWSRDGHRWGRKEGGLVEWYYYYWYSSRSNCNSVSGSITRYYCLSFLCHDEIEVIKEYSVYIKPNPCTVQISKPDDYVTGTSLSSTGNVLAIGRALANFAVGGTWLFTYNGSSYNQIGDVLVGSGNVGAGFQGQQALCVWEGGDEHMYWSVCNLCAFVLFFSKD